MQTYVDWIAPTFVLSLTGLPVASVPCGLDARGLPVGLQIVGRMGGEEAVLALAAEIQRAAHSRAGIQIGLRRRVPEGGLAVST
jgi:amidase